ncbi:MAG: hypothetical protein KIT88_10445 [Phycisphaeraceae bacterium]|nr:hypothetical protein [Phycisphaeraceae bacterium]
MYEYNGLNWRTLRRYDSGTTQATAVDDERIYYYSAAWQVVEEHIDEDFGTSAGLDRVIQQVWGVRYIDDLVARRVQHGLPGTTYTPPDGAWSHGDLALTLSDSMFSVRRVIGDDWGSTSHSVWLRERASLEVDYAAYGEPDAIVGLA